LGGRVSARSEWVTEKVVSESDLRRLVLDVLATGSTDDWGSIRTEVMTRVSAEDLGPIGREQRVNQVIVSLLIEQLITVGARDGNYTPRSWPSIMLTELGKKWAADTTRLRDPDGYGALLREYAPGVEAASVEYALEAFRCLRQNLLFACAVMIGAAAEREVFRLGRAILVSETDAAAKKLKDALERGRLPALFQEIRTAIETAIQRDAMPFSVHQGSTAHLFSFQEMIRVHRNDAVHAGGTTVSKEKVFLAIQTFPVAVGAIDRLRSWFEARRT
jgi:hypothetical protein